MAAPKEYPLLPVALAAAIACGPSVHNADGGGSGATGTDGGDAADSADHDASGADMDGSGTMDSASDACPYSDLPEPFCHDLLTVSPTEDIVLGVHEQVRDGVRPLVTLAPEAELVRLVDPIDPSVVFAEAPLPFRPPESSGDFRRGVVNGDFNGDGTIDIALTTTELEASQLAILDGASLATIAYQDYLEDPAVIGIRAAALDLDADGTDELVVAEIDSPFDGAPDDDGVRLRAWALGDGLTLLGSAPAAGPGARCDSPWMVGGDYDGDGVRDLALAWGDGCEAYEALDPPAIVSLLGGSGLGPVLDLQVSPQPPGAGAAAAGDVDGDGADELVIAESVYEIRVIDWSADGFAVTEILTAGDRETFGGVELRIGKFARQLPDGVLIGQLVQPAADGSIDYSYDGALFPNTTFQNLLVLPNEPLLVADFNDDGIADFSTFVDDQPALYLSVP